MAKSRPKRRSTQWNDLRLASDWFLKECERRGFERSDALEQLSQISPTAIIRRYNDALVRAKEDADRLLNTKLLPGIAPPNFQPKTEPDPRLKDSDPALQSLAATLQRRRNQSETKNIHPLPFSPVELIPGRDIPAPHEMDQT